MSVPIRKTLLIKHVTGRLLLDTQKNGCDFTLERCDDTWHINVFNTNKEIMKEIERLQAELNMFYFEETGEEQDRRIQKWWIYDTVQPKFSLNEALGQVTLILNTRIGYSNEHTNAGK
jgi:hypothetical protein